MVHAVKDAQYKNRKLRIMQVQTLYPRYVQALYAANPHLGAESFAKQMQSCVRDAYGAIHMLVPYLNECTTLLALPNCVPMQLAWLKEHNLERPQQADWQHEIVRLQIKHFKPDVLYLTDSITFDARFLKTLPFIPPCILGWRAADIPAHIEWTGFDAILSGLPRLLALAKTLGAKDGIMFHPGMPSWIAKEISNIPQEVDVVFVGSISPTQHVRRLEFLDLVAEQAAVHGFSLELYLNCPESFISAAMRPYVRPAVFGIDMHKVLRRGKIVLDSQGSIGFKKPNGEYMLDLASGDTSNMRLFEGTGGGSLVLTEHRQGISRYFEIDKEIVTYKSHTQAVEKIIYYLKKHGEREAIAKAGQERCLKDWNMQAAAQKFLEIAQNILKQK